MSSVYDPTSEELQESERLLAELRAGLAEFTSDPTLLLLPDARAPASVDELADAGRLRATRGRGISRGRVHAAGAAPGSADAGATATDRVPGAVNGNGAARSGGTAAPTSV